MDLQEVCCLLSSVGVPAKVHGRRYLLKAVDILMNDDEAAFAITKRVYMKVADDFDIECKQVENAMRLAIEQAWKMGGCDRQEKIFGYSRLVRKRPTNSEFLLGVAEYLKTNDQ